MSKGSTIKDLRAKAKQLEARKREIDKNVEAIYTILRVFEQSQIGEVITDRLSSYAQELTNAMYDILISKRPLHRKSIFDRLTVRGIHVGGQIPVNTVGSYLSIDDRFKNVGRGMWDLAHPILPIDQSSEDLDMLADDVAHTTNGNIHNNLLPKAS